MRTWEALAIDACRAIIAAAFAWWVRRQRRNYRESEKP